MMKKASTDLFWMIAGLGLAGWMIGEMQSSAPRAAYAARQAMPLVRAAVWVVIAVLALVLIGLVIYAIHEWRYHLRVKRAELAKLEAETVRIETAGGLAVAVNGLGMPLQNITMDSRSYILPGEDMPDQIALLKLLYYFGRNQKVINQLTENIGQLPPPIWPARVNLFDYLTAARGDLNKIILGETVDAESGQRRPVTVALEDMVHVASGGETGTGKSSLAYSLVYQIATAPQAARLVLADPAGTTWKTFAGHERLMYPLVSDEAALQHVLGELLAECEHRTEHLFAPYPTVEKLSEYNALVDEAARLDYIVCAIDEFPEYMESKPIQAVFRRLIRKSRKAGIFLFALGTSWKATDMDSGIKRQFRTKVHFAASEPESSRVLLSDPRAAELKAPGRAYARLPFGTSADLIELQCAYVDKADVMGQLERPSILSLPVGPEISNAEAMGESAVVDAYQDGNSLNECYRIYHQVTTGQPWPAGKRLGSQHTQLVKDILRRNGIDPESA